MDNGRLVSGWSRRGTGNRLGLTVGESLGIPETGSHEEFIVEHYWGYTRRSPTRTDEYLVEHVPWNVYRVSDPIIDVDFGRTYGDKFAFLSDQPPYSVLFAKGSEVIVYKGNR